MKNHIDEDDFLNRRLAMCKDLTATIRLCIEVSGHSRKEVAHELGIRESELSRMLSSGGSGERRYFPSEKLNLLMDICDNEIPLKWLAFSRGFGLLRLQSALERENEELKKHLADVEKKLEYLKSILGEIKSEEGNSLIIER